MITRVVDRSQDPENEKRILFGSRQLFIYGMLFPKLLVDLLSPAFGGAVAGCAMAMVYLAIRRLWHGRFSWRDARRTAVRWGVTGACLATGLASVLIGLGLALHIAS